MSELATIESTLRAVGSAIGVPLRVDSALVSSHHNNSGEFRTIITQDSAGQLDIRLNEIDAAAAVRFRNRVSRKSLPLYLWNGLLREEEDSITVNVPSATSETSSFLFQICSSPDGINAAQTSLGGKLGVDTFSIKRSSSAGNTKAGKWLVGFANFEIWISSLNNWPMTEHNTFPRGHVLSWFITHPTIRKMMARRAQHIYQEHGENVYRIPLHRPREVGLFAAATDSLDNYTNPIFSNIDKITKLFEHALTADEAVRMLSMSLNKRRRNSMQYQDPQGQFHDYPSARLWQELGAMDTGPFSWLSRYKQQRKISYMIAGHTAQLLLNAAETGAGDNHSSPNSKRREDFWRKVVTEYSDAQLAV